MLISIFPALWHVKRKARAYASTLECSTTTVYQLTGRWKKREHVIETRKNHGKTRHSAKWKCVRDRETREVSNEDRDDFVIEEMNQWMPPNGFLPADFQLLLDMKIPFSSTSSLMKRASWPARVRSREKRSKNNWEYSWRRIEKQLRLPRITRNSEKEKWGGVWHPQLSVSDATYTAYNYHESKTNFVT